jgi:hypothetical protein
MAKQSQKFSEQIRRAIDDCGKTRYWIWKKTGIAQSTLSEFMSGGRGLSMANLDLLAECLGLKIVFESEPAKAADRKPAKAKGR